MGESDRQLSFESLDSTQFEEFCYDLLQNMGFVNLNWRKGTGHASSPSDQGRDIQCQLEVTDVDGQKFLETWFVECKHQKTAIPPEKLQGALSWASAERPDKLLIITSGYLSNPTKTNLEKIQINASYRIKYWEHKQLQDLTLGKGRSALLMKYGLLGDLPFVKFLHPVHLLYIRDAPINTLDYFFEVLEALPPSVRQRLMGLAFEVIIRPEHRRPISMRETLGELRVGEVSFRRFQEKCRELAKSLSEFTVIFLCIHLSLWELFRGADLSSREEKLMTYRLTINLVQQKILERPEEADDYENLIQETEKRINNIDAQMRQDHDLYNYFCEHVVLKLLNEPPSRLKIMEGY